MRQSLSHQRFADDELLLLVYKKVLLLSPFFFYRPHSTAQLLINRLSLSYHSTSVISFVVCTLNNKIKWHHMNLVYFNALTGGATTAWTKLAIVCDSSSAATTTKNNSTLTTAGNHYQESTSTNSVWRRRRGGIVIVVSVPETLVELREKLERKIFSLFHFKTRLITWGDVKDTMKLRNVENSFKNWSGNNNWPPQSRTLKRIEQYVVE